jgi:hypothetical protein
MPESAPAEYDWLLRGARVALGPREAQRLDITVRGGVISGQGGQSPGFIVKFHAR